MPAYPSSFRLALLWLLATLALLTGGCTAMVRNDPDLPEIPDSWSNAQAGESHLRRGVFLDDSLQRLMAEATEKNSSLQAMAVRLGRAEALYQVTAGERYPQLAAGMEVSREEVREGEDNGSMRAGRFAPYFSVSWEVDLWGRLQDRASAAGHEYLASEEDYQAARLALRIKVAKTWYQAITGKMQMQQAANIADSYRATLEAVEERYTAGLTQALDLSMARTAYSHSLGELEARRADFTRSLRSLQVLVGAYPDGSLQVPDDLPSRVPEVPVGVPADMVLSRPDLKAARFRIESAHGLWSAAVKERLPLLTLTARAEGSRSSLGDSLDPAFGLWRLAVGVVQPVFDAGRLKNQAMEAGYGLQQQQFDYCELLRNAFLEVEDALSAEQSLRKQLAAAGRTAEDAEISWKAAVEQYRLGTVDLLTVLLNQRQHLESQVDLIDLKNHLLQASIDLALALGTDALFSPDGPV